ncbi:MAG TPA: lysophospholipid acyltransferase family protein [Caulobacteraceae bacterium]|jgi:1-acyl-sn-glycerol-3-phosphate acyltransferase|nr:lysophospholipid acyltransferase family protein [Caulobacteraceae bacterium]
MIVLRSLVFVVLFYLWSALMVVVLAPVMLGPRRWTLAAMHVWARGFMALLEPICGIEVVVRGREHLPAGAAFVAAKHQCMLDALGTVAFFDDACFVTKQELFAIPFFGWWSRRAGMIAVDRGGRSAALRKMVSDARARMSEARQLIIFPEGHRMAPGETGDYQPGVAALYRELGLPCTPLATNSGLHWPAHGFIRRPGRIVYEFLEPIPAGLHRSAFMRTLQERIETASRRLLAE